MQVLLAKPRGFCAGVDRAIQIVERALQIHGAPIYVRHEVVHNKFVTDDLRWKGAVFVEDLSEVPVGSTLIFSAHGVSQGVRREAEARGLKVFDAICPLVTKVHVEVAKMRRVVQSGCYAARQTGSAVPAGGSRPGCRCNMRKESMRRGRVWRERPPRPDATNQSRRRGRWSISLILWSTQCDSRPPESRFPN
jgi:LytB protein